MTKLNEILDLIKTLSKEDLECLKKALLSETNSQNITEYVKAHRFSQGRICPICGCINIVRYGHTNNKQRYKCKDCGKTFVITTNSCVERTHKEMTVWEKYIHCMIDEFSVRKSAEICGIHKNTAFIWRHKILDALQIIQNSIVIDGIAEADETFISVSFKGNHKKNKNFTMPRPSRHRGKDKMYDEKGNRVKKKVALSFDLVCVPCMVNRDGLSVAKVQ